MFRIPKLVSPLKHSKFPSVCISHLSGSYFSFKFCLAIVFCTVSRYNFTLSFSLLFFESFIMCITIGTAIKAMIASITITASNSINVNFTSHSFPTFLTL